MGPYIQFHNPGTMGFSSHISHLLFTTSYYYKRPSSMAKTSIYAPFANPSNLFLSSEFPNSAQES